MRLGLGPDDADEVAHAAQLHDIGKVGVPDTILTKPGPLEEDELDFIHRHTLIGERIVRRAPALEGVARLVRSSHERWDGDGYPDGLAGPSIPLGARIVAVCDAFQAMVSDRPYRDVVPADAALREIERCAGAQFDPAVVERSPDAVRRSGRGARRAHHRAQRARAGRVSAAWLNFLAPRNGRCAAQGPGGRPLGGTAARFTRSRSAASRAW